MLPHVPALLSSFSFRRRHTARPLARLSALSAPAPRPAFLPSGAAASMMADVFRSRCQSHRYMRHTSSRPRLLMLKRLVS